MKGKPIEPGCLAMIVRAKHCKENIGRVVRVVRRPTGPLEPIPAFIPKINPWMADVWVIEPLPGQPMLTVARVRGPTRELVSKHASMVAAVVQRNLIRIDDDEAPKEVTRTVVKSKPVDEVI